MFGKISCGSNLPFYCDRILLQRMAMASSRWHSDLCPASLVSWATALCSPATPWCLNKIWEVALRNQSKLLVLHSVLLIPGGLILVPFPMQPKCYATGFCLAHRAPAQHSLAHGGPLGLDCLTGSLYFGPLALIGLGFCPHGCHWAPTLAGYSLSFSFSCALTQPSGSQSSSLSLILFILGSWLCLSLLLGFHPMQLPGPRLWQGSFPGLDWYRVCPRHPVWGLLTIPNC